MYPFKDTIDTAESSFRPAEAVRVDGQYLEDLIPGYRTLNVSGRETLGSEISEKGLVGDGARYYSSRYPARDIKVTYQLMAESSQAFREAFNKLNIALDGTHEWVFEDEPDKYFVGSKSEVEIPEPGRLSCNGTFTIHCPDPHKYALQAKEFTAAKNADGIYEAVIENSGMPCDSEISVTNKVNNGYLGIVSAQGAMEFGLTPDNEAGHMERIGTLADLLTLTKDSTWYFGSGAALSQDPQTVTATPDAKSDFAKANHKWLAMSTAGWNTTASKFGTAITWALPAASDGTTEARDFDVFLFHWFACQYANQHGSQQINFLTADNNPLCSINIYKNADSTQSSIEFRVGTTVKKRINFEAADFLDLNPFAKGSNGYNMIRKVKDVFTFFWWGSYFTYTDSSLKDLKCAKVQVSFLMYGKGLPASRYMTRNYLGAFDFNRLDVTGEQDQDSRFPKGSTMKVDTAEGTFYLNGMEKPEYEVIGSKYFKIPAGSSKIQFFLSSWVQTAPEIKVRIRERWI